MFNLWRIDDASGYKVMSSSETGSNYLVPVGKKAIVLSCTITLSGTGATYQGIALYEHTVASTAGGTALWKYYTPLVSGAGANVVFTIPMYIEISAGNYINFQHDSSYIRESMLVLECDA
jgi:hypothetical protein